MRRVDAVVALLVSPPQQWPECLEPGRRPVSHAERDGEVEGHRGRGREAVEHAVKHDDLQPVGGLGGGGFAMDSGDGCLELERSKSPLRRSSAARTAGVSERHTSSQQ